MAKRIRWAGVLICFGLAVQALTLMWVHPLSFMAFLMIGCPLTGAGVLLYLYSLIAGKSDGSPAINP